MQNIKRLDAYLKVFNRVRENEVLYQTALSIAYSSITQHWHINALTLFP